MTANFKARAANPGKCALAGCRMAGGKIYEGDGLRLLCCTEGHANAVLGKIAKAVAATGCTRDQRDAALRVFNERGRSAPTEATAADDFDIPI